MFPIIIKLLGWQSRENAFVIFLKEICGVFHIFVYLYLSLFSMQSVCFLPMSYICYQKVMSHGLWISLILIFYSKYFIFSLQRESFQISSE
jgi:hypothetical protein